MSRIRGPAAVARRHAIIDIVIIIIIIIQVQGSIKAEGATTTTGSAMCTLVSGSGAYDGNAVARPVA